MLGNAVWRKSLPEKNSYFHSGIHTIVKLAIVLVLMNICTPPQVCSKSILPMSLLGRTNGRINNHIYNKILNPAMKGKYDKIYFLSYAINLKKFLKL